MSGLRCPDCKRLIKDLTQAKSAEFGEIRIEGYCEHCHAYISWPVVISEFADYEDEAEEAQDSAGE